MTSPTWYGLPPHVKLQKFGAIPDVDAGDTDEAVWDGTGAYPGFLAAATTMTTSSSSTADTSAGTGARTVRWFYMDSSYVESSVDITMNGQSAASTTFEAYRIYRGYVLTAGSGGSNAGDIWAGSGTITTGVPANKYAGMLATNGQTKMAVYTIPSQLADGQKIAGGILRHLYATSGGGAASARCEMELQTREPGGAWRSRKVFGVTAGANFDSYVDLPLAVGTDVRVRIVTNATNNSTFQAGFDIALLKT